MLILGITVYRSPLQEPWTAGTKNPAAGVPMRGLIANAVRGCAVLGARADPGAPYRPILDAMMAAWVRFSTPSARRMAVT